MISDAQYAALGPLGREIIDFDRRASAEADAIARLDVVDIGVGQHLRERRHERERLSAAAGVICNRPSSRGGGPRNAASVRA